MFSHRRSKGEEKGNKNEKLKIGKDYMTNEAPKHETHKTHHSAPCAVTPTLALHITLINETYRYEVVERSKT